MASQQVQIKVSLSTKLNELLRLKADTLGVPTTQLVKHLIIKEVEDKYFELEEFETIPLEQLKTELTATGKYSDKFINSLIKGFEKSPLYEKR